MRSILSLIPFCFLILELNAQISPQLIKQIKGKPNDTYAETDWMLGVYNDIQYFFRNDGENGCELYRTDGTAAGTYLVKDIVPGKYSSRLWTFKTYAIAENGFYFCVNLPSKEGQLWFSDGTESGTRLIQGGYKNLNISFSDGTGCYFTSSLTNDMKLEQLNYTDGTPTGTVTIMELGNNYSVVNGFKLNAKTFFYLQDGSKGNLFITNGSAAGTMRINTLPKAEYGRLQQHCIVDDKAFIRLVNDSTGKTEYWSTTNPETGASKLLTTGTQSFGSYLNKMVAYQGKLYFTVYEQNFGEELWTSDGTETGTTKFLEGVTGSGGLSPTNFRIMNGILYFQGSDNNSSMWKCDGTVAGTYNICKRYVSMSNAVVFKNRIYFAKTTPSVSGTELWATDGIDSTSAFMIKDIESGSGSGYPKCISVVNDFLLVSATTTSTGQELWRCDGTSDGTELIKDLYPGFYGEAFNLRVINGKMIFDSQFANEYKYTSNGTPEGTYPLAFSSVGNNFHPAYGNPVLNGFVYFSGKALADSGNADFELWRTDGTPSGTTRVKDIAPGLGSSIPKYAVGIGNKLYFNAAPDALSNSEPWVTDGTEAGTKKLAEINPGSASSNPMYFTECNGKVFFAAQSTNPVSYNQLWVTDGTPAGTKLVKNFGGYDNIWQLRDLKGTLIFRLGGYLYRSDGTEAGTIKIKPSSQGYVSAGTFPGFGEYDCDGKYYYFRGVDNNIPMIYITDGTDAGTVRLPIDSPPSNIISVGNIRYVNGKIFFNLVFNDGSNYQEWTYCTDGTQTGTKRLFQPSFGRIQGGTIIGNNGKEIFFNTSDYLTPMDHSIVISDGTPQGTKLYSVDDPEELQRAASIVELNGLLYGTIFDQMRGSALYLLERGDVSIRMYSVKQNALKIYPNPSNDIIELDIATDTQVDIYDMTGKKHVSLKYNGSIDIAELAAGSYQVIALSGKEAFTAKLMKTN